MNGKAGDVRIRPMTTDDLDRVIALAESVREAPHWPRRAFAAALDPDAEPQRVALAAESANAGVIGFAIAVVIPPHAELESIAVAVEAQRRGVARELFAALACELKRRQITEVLLEVRPSNERATSVYRALGFEETGCRPGYYADPEEDAVLMRLSLG